MLQTLFLLGVERRLASLLFIVLTTLVAALGLPYLAVDTGFGRMIADADPGKQAWLQTARTFGSDNRTIVYVRDETLWTPDKLAALERLHHALEALPFVERVDGVFNLRSIRGVAGGIEARPIMLEAPRDQAGADQAREDALYNPLVVRNLVSPDGRAVALVVSVRENDTGDFDRAAYRDMEAVVERARPAFTEVFQIGPPRINAELTASLYRDLMVLAPTSAALLVLTILFFFRSFTAALIPLLTAGLSILWTLGMMGLAGIPISILLAMLPSLVVVIGSTEDVHMVAGYYRGLAEAQAGKVSGARAMRSAATRIMVRHLGVPTILTVLTTVVGFSSNAFSPLGLIRDFAIASAFAVLANGLITVLLVPMLLAWFGPRVARGLPGAMPGGLPGAAVRTFGALRHRYSLVVLVVTAMMCGGFVWQASKLYVTNDPMTYFRGDRPLVHDTERVQRDLSGVKVFYITLRSRSPKAFLEPAQLEKLVEIQAFIEKQGLFDRSLSLADHLALVNREFNGGKAEAWAVPATRNLVAQYLLFFHRSDLSPYVSHDFSQANIVVRHNVSDSRRLNRHIAELREAVRHFAGPDLQTTVTGENLMINAAADTLIGGQIEALGIVLAVIFLMMSLMFTSLKGGLIALVPSVIPIILMLGIMGLLGIPLNPGTAMVAVIAIGIAIDGTIHLFSRYNALCRTTSNYDEAVLETVKDEALPVVATSLALALGFGVLLLSDFTVVAQFGALAAATMLFSVFANLLITPLVMSRIRLVGLYDILAMSMQREVLEKSPLFHDMTNYQIRKAILISELREVPTGELLVEQGTAGRSMYLVLSGELDVVRRAGDGSERVLARLGPGQVFGEIGYIRATQRTADVRAVTPVTALCFDHQRMAKDLRFFPHIVAKLNFNISRILGERL
ncbi:MAG TPA: MMPL family transporter, partial [Burkholderiales bacterium]